MKLPQYDNRPKANQPLYDPNYGKDAFGPTKEAAWSLLFLIGLPVCLGLIGWSIFSFLRTIFGH